MPFYLVQVTVYMFYKNALLVLPQFFFAFMSLSSGQNFYYDLLYQSYNVFFTSLPIIALGVLDQARTYTSRTKYLSSHVYHLSGAPVPSTQREVHQRPFEQPKECPIPSVLTPHVHDAHVHTVFSRAELAIFAEQDVTPEVVLAHPILYQDGVQRVFLTPRIFWR